MKNLIGRAVFAAFCLSISGCTLIERIDAATSSDGASRAPTVAELRQQVDWAEPGSPGPGDLKDKKAETAFVPRPKSKPVIVDPKMLVGLDKSAIAEILGEPHRITLAQPATVWAWEQDGCRMRLFFYPDLAKQKFRALTYEISTGAKNKYQRARDSMLIETCASRIKWANAGTAR